jgi:hypothetical protein
MGGWIFYTSKPHNPMSLILLAFVLYSLHTIVTPVLAQALWNWVFKTSPEVPGPVNHAPQIMASYTDSKGKGQVSPVPEGVLAYARSWGADWAEADILERAKALYAELGNWDAVYAELLLQDSEKDN